MIVWSSAAVSAGMAVLRAKWPPIIGAGARGGIRCGGKDRAAAGMMEPTSRGGTHVQSQRRHHQIGRAACRGRGENSGGAVSLKKKKKRDLRRERDKDDRIKTCKSRRRSYSESADKSRASEQGRLGVVGS